MPLGFIPLGFLSGDVDFNVKPGGNFEDGVLDRKFEVVSDEELIEWLKLLKRQKDILPAFMDSDVGRFTEERNHYLASKDLFDIALMAKLIVSGNVDFNENYFDELVIEKGWR